MNQGLRPAGDDNPIGEREFVPFRSVTGRR